MLSICQVPTAKIEISLPILAIAHLGHLISHSILPEESFDPWLHIEHSWNNLIRIVCSFSACPEGRFGQDCMEQCLCENGAHCHPETGKCTCKIGFIGQLCDRGTCNMF